MSGDFRLWLGSFGFSNKEIPATINFGGEQKLAVHELVGGKRVVDVLGYQPSVMEWSGLMLGPLAVQRAQALQLLQAQGVVLSLRWSTLSFRVVIKSFKANFERHYQVPYRIECEVVEDLGLVALVSSPGSALDDVLADDMDQVIELTAVVGNAPLQRSVSAIQSAMQAINSFATATQAMLNSVLEPIAEARAVTQQLLAQVNNVTQSMTTLGGILPNNPVARQANHLLNQANALNSAPVLVQMDGVLGRMQSNLKTDNSASTSVPVANGASLHDLAADHYGDATQWTTIAKANGLSDPVVSAPAGMQLVIPSAASGSGGVLNA